MPRLKMTAPLGDARQPYLLDDAGAVARARRALYFAMLMFAMSPSFFLLPFDVYFAIRRR